MALYYCSECKTAFLPESTVTDGQHLFCKKCKVQLENLGAEDGQVSLQAHLEAQQITKAKDIYHDYSLIKSKHYTAPKKDPILIDCESKLNLNPLDIDALFTLSKWYYSRGLQNESIAIIKQILKIDPNFLPAHDFLSQQNSAQKEDTLPNDIKTLEEMGINYLNSKNYSDAETIFKKLLQLDSKHPAAQRYMADIYTHKKEYDNVIHVLNRLSLQFPDDDTILFNLAVACYNAQDFKRAKSNLKAARKLARDADFIKEIDRFLLHLTSFT